MTNHSLTQKNMTNYNIVLPTPSVSKHNNNNHSKAGPKSLVKEPQHHNNKSSKPKSKKQQPSPFNEKQELAVVTNNNNKQVKKKVKSQQQQQPSSHVMNNNNNKIQQQQQKPHHHQHHQQQRRNVMPVKVRRVERRKEIVSMTEALHTSQVDLLSASPPVSSSSSNESSDDSDTGRMEQKSFKKKPNLPSPASFPPLAKKSPPRRQQGDKRVYAGPTFNNAPAPSCLPLPSLSESQPSPPSVHQEASSSSSSFSSHNDDIFFMEVIPPHPHRHHQQYPLPHPHLPVHHHQHPLPPPHFHQMDLQQQSRDLMNLLAPRRQLPLSPMVMSHPPVDHTLSQIQRDLRSMLKLEAAS